MTNHDSASQHPVARVVYFAQLGHYLKVGVTTNVTRRLKELPWASATATHPEHLPPGPAVLLGTLPGGMDVEADMHGWLWEWRVVGEWYEATPEVLAFVAEKLEAAA